MKKYDDLLKSVKEQIQNPIDDKKIENNQDLKQVIELTIFLAYKELCIKKDSTNNNQILYFDEEENKNMVPYFEKIADYIRKQPNSFIKDNLKIKLKNNNPDLEETIWIVNKVRDSIAHKSFEIDEEKDMLIIDNDSSNDSHHAPNNPYKLKCSIPFELLRDSNKYSSISEELSKVVNDNTYTHNTDLNTCIFFSYFLLFFIDDKRTIDYKFLDLEGIITLVLKKDKMNFLSKKDNFEQTIHKRIEHQINLIYAMETYKPELKESIIKNSAFIINEILKHIAFLNEEIITFFRNSIMHINLGGTTDSKINLIDRTNQNNPYETKVGIIVSKERLFKLTSDIENEQLYNDYTVSNMLTNLSYMSWNEREHIKNYLNTIFKLAFNKELEENDNIIELIEKINNYTTYNQMNYTVSSLDLTKKLVRKN